MGTPFCAARQLTPSIHTSTHPSLHPHTIHLLCRTFQILASKFYGLYSLLRDLLSKQLHYDWGLRAVKSVLVVAGGFKRAEPDLLEEALLMRALRDFNIPKIVREDEVVFFGLLGDLFPGIDPPRKVCPCLAPI